MLFLLVFSFLGIKPDIYMPDLDLCEDKITHTEIWKKHIDTMHLLSITEVKLQKL